MKFYIDAVSLKHISLPSENQETTAVRTWDFTTPAGVHHAGSRENTKYVIEIETLDDLMRLLELYRDVTNGWGLVLMPADKEYNPSYPTIEIYNGWRE